MTIAYSGAESVSIVIVSGDRLSCRLLESELSKYPQFKVVDIAFSLEQLLAVFAHSQPAIVLMGLSLQDGPLSGLNAIHQVRSSHPETRFILLTDHIEQDVAVAAIRSGARGIFCFSESDLCSLRKCIECVHSGQIWASTQILNYVLEAFGVAVPPRIVNVNGEVLLTPREDTVAQLVAQGLTNREIANQLGLSESTIKNYLFRIYDKLGVSNRIELGLYASAHSLRRITENDLLSRKGAASERAGIPRSKPVAAGGQA